MATTVNDRLVRGSDFGVFISDQAVYGTLDASPVFTPVRRTTGKPKATIGYTQDDSVTTDNQGVQNIQDTSEYGMELAASFSKQSVDWLIKAVHGTEVVSTNTDTVYAADGTGFTLESTMYAALEVRDAFWISGFADNSIDGFYIVASKDGANHVTTTVAPAATETAGASVTFTSRKTENNTTPTYSILQKRVTDTGAGGTAYKTFYDAVIDTMSVEVGETGIVSGTATFVAEQQVSGEAAIAGQTTAAALTDRSVSAVQDITRWYVDGVSANCDQKSISVEIANGYQGDDAAACAKQYARGQFAVTGSAAFRARVSEPLEWETYYLNGTRKELGVLIAHPGGGNTFILMPQCAITEHEQPDGNNDIATHEVSFGAEGSSVTGNTIMVFRDWS